MNNYFMYINMKNYNGLYILSNFSSYGCYDEVGKENMLTYSSNEINTNTDLHYYYILSQIKIRIDNINMPK